MKQIAAIVLVIFISCHSLFAQDNDLLLAKQFAASGETQKALDIYQKLYKQDNETYYSEYINALLSVKKYDEAEITAKKIIRRHPAEPLYMISLGKIYGQKGDINKANSVYDDLIKNMPANQGAITSLAMQFYQAENVDYAIRIFVQGRKLLHNDKLYTSELLSLYRFKKDKASLTEEYLNFLPDNPAYISQAENAMAGVYEGEPDYTMLKVALLKRIQKDPQQTIYVDLLIWQFLQQKDFDQALNQSIALSRRQNDDGNSIFELCQTFVSNQAYDVAIRGYEYLLSRGADQQLYIPAKIELINTKNLLVTSGKYTQADLLSLEKDYTDLLDKFGKTPSTAFAMQKLAVLQAFKLHKPDDAQKLLEDIIKLPDLKPNMLATSKLDLGDVYLMNNQPWEATLLYSQVEKAYPNSTIGQDANFRNAKLAYYTGDFNWAKGQLDVLKASTTQLIANDALNLSLLITGNLAADSAGKALKMYARADLQIFEEQPAKAVMILDSIDIKYPGNALSDDVLMARARILLQQKNYAEALVPLKKILDEHPAELWADDAVFMLGDLYENHLNDKEQARIYYQKIITAYPGSLWLNEARKRFRLLRGDKPDGAS